MIRTGALLLSMMLLALVLAAQTAPPGANPAPTPPQSSTAPDTMEPTPQAQAHATVEKAAADLNLTADQKSKLEPILTGEIQTVHDLRADTTMTPEQKQAKFQQAMADAHTKIEAILTPEQKQKLQQMNAQRAQQQGQTPAPHSAPAAPPTEQQPPK
jgi:periplasmic protein CpxP/Spy